MDIVSFSWAVIVMFVIKICSVVSVQYNIGERETECVRERERERERERKRVWKHLCVLGEPITHVAWVTNPFLGLVFIASVAYQMKF